MAGTFTSASMSRDRNVGPKASQAGWPVRPPERGERPHDHRRVCGQTASMFSIESDPGAARGPRRWPALLLTALAAGASSAAAQSPASPDVPPPTQEAEPEREEPPGYLSPTEFHRIGSGVVLNAPEATPGLTIVAPINSRSIHLLDLDGEIVHTWETEYAPGEWCYLLDDGNLLRSAREDDDPHFRGGGIGGRLQLLAPDGSVRWTHRIADENRHAHHDIEPLPNGNLLVILWERKSAEQAIARGREPKHVGAAGLWPDAVLELKPTLPEGAEVVWEWHAWDHLVQDFDPGAAGYGDVPANPGLIDVNGDHRRDRPMTEAERKQEQELHEQLAALGYIGGAPADDDDEEDLSFLDRSGDMMHTNALAYLPEHDLIVLSTPEYGELWVIDHSTTSEEAAGSTGGRFGRGGEILWRWGNPRQYGRGGDDDQHLFYQHNPTWLPSEDPNELRLLVFNNRAHGDGEDRYSTVEELAIPFDPERGFPLPTSEPFGPAEPSWTYQDRGNFYSSFISGAQRLASGNTLICSGAAGRIFEVTADGRVVWDYYGTLGGDVEPPDHAGKAPAQSIFRAVRIPNEHPGIQAILRFARGNADR